METSTRVDESPALRSRHPLQPLADTLGRLVAKTGIHPDALTLASLVVAVIGTWSLATGRFLVAPFVFLFAASLDFLDGAVARETGKASLAGGYTDSLVDRYVDFLVLFGIMLALDSTRMWIVGSVALFGVLLTSGAKWRIHEDHHPAATEWGRDLFERTERYFVLLPGIFLHGIWIHIGYRGEPLFWVVLVVAVLANLTVLQRILKARRILRALGTRPRS
jgi:phosphatidylglycerophosphate synthase